MTDTVVAQLRCWVLPLFAASAVAAAQAAVVVPVEIDLRAEIAAGRFDPVHDSVGVRGSQAPLSWQQSVLAQPRGDGRYALELRFERVPFGGQPVQYKFRVERSGQGPDDGWEAGRNHPLLLDAAAPRITRAFNAPAQIVPPRRTGRIERLGVVDSTHVAPRAVQVWLPPAYAADLAKRYPVLYLNDGQNVFDAEAAGAEWQVDETAQRLAEQGVIEPPIVVAIDSGRTRVDDYTPTAMTMGAERTGTGRSERVGGGAPAYARFLVEELKPLIDRRYRTRADAASTAVGGSSLGGLVSLWLALHQGTTFGNALVVSPSVWWDDAFALRDVTTLPAPSLPIPRARLWLDIGALEGAEALPAVRQLQQALTSRGWNSSTLAYTEAPHGSHDEASWAARVEAMLKFLYARPPAAPR